MNVFWKCVASGTHWSEHIHRKAFRWIIFSSNRCWTKESFEIFYLQFNLFLILFGIHEKNLFEFLGAPPLRGRFGPIGPKSSSQSRTWTPNLHRHELNPLTAEIGGMKWTWWTYFLPEESLRCRPMTQQGLSPSAIAPWGTSPAQPCQCRVPLYQVSCFLKRAVGLLKPLQGPPLGWRLVSKEEKLESEFLGWGPKC